MRRKKMTQLSADQLQGAVGGQARDVCGHDMQGLLHDLGHQLLTLSLLAEPLRRDASLSARSRHRMELVRRETIRALDMVTNAVSAPGPDGYLDRDDQADVRALAGQVAQLSALAYSAEIRLLPGPPAKLPGGATMLWRVLTNLVDNAARAAGPHGHVRISVARGRAGDVVVEVRDDGPGLTEGPAGLAGLGLSVVDGLLRESGGGMATAPAPGGGTSVRATFSRCARQPPAVSSFEPGH
jgi:signal transduction histidine kinase